MDYHSALRFYRPHFLALHTIIGYSPRIAPEKPLHDAQYEGLW
ncbi:MULTISPECIES: hypothetical protein [Sphingomonadales]|nr:MULTISPECIES: hypothetical protein [Sphingomonadales]